MCNVYVCLVDKKERVRNGMDRNCLPSGSLAITVVLRSTPPFLSSVPIKKNTDIHQHAIENSERATHFCLIQ